MAQLVKLYDYISRYEQDIYRYPSRFVRLKRERWDRLLSDWNNRHQTFNSLDVLYNQMRENNQKTNLRDRIKKWFPFRKVTDDMRDESLTNVLQLDQEYKKLSKISNKEQLKQLFKEEVLNFQISWASSTLSEKSEVSRKYYYDPLLAFLIKELPDSYFIFYEPVFYLKKAPVDFNIVILTPSEIWVIASLMGNEDTIYQYFSDRYWLKSYKGKEEKLLHPAITIKRMRAVTEHILLDNNLSYPIRTAIMAKDSYIDISPKLQRIKLIDRRNFSEWHQLLIRNSTPIKHEQLKIGEALLSQCLTNSLTRDRTNGDNMFTNEAFKEE